MRPPEEIKRKIVEDWLRRADSDFNLAGHLLLPFAKKELHYGDKD